MVVDITDIEKTRELARDLAKSTKKGNVIALVGELGTGKTTFVQYLLQALGVEERVTSPTFILQRAYELPTLQTSAYHIDLYRTENAGVARDLTLDFDNQVTIIEWPQLLKDLLPERTKWITFKLDGSKRTAEIRTKQKITIS